jgi:hypothetical protein
MGSVAEVEREERDRISALGGPLICHITGGGTLLRLKAASV